MFLSTSAFAAQALCMTAEQWYSAGAPKPSYVNPVENAIVRVLYGQHGLGLEQPCMPQLFPEDDDAFVLPRLLTDGPIAFRPICDGIRPPFEMFTQYQTDEYVHCLLLLKAHLWIHLDSHPVELFTPLINGTRQLGIRAKVAMPKGTKLYCLVGYYSETFPIDRAHGHPSVVQVNYEQQLAAVMCGPARFLNSVCTGRHCLACRGNNNCELVPFGPKGKKSAYVALIKDVAEGQELLMSYGADYFKGKPCGRQQ